MNDIFKNANETIERDFPKEFVISKMHIIYLHTCKELASESLNLIIVNVVS